MALIHDILARVANDVRTYINKTFSGANNTFTMIPLSAIDPNDISDGGFLDFEEVVNTAAINTANTNSRIIYTTSNGKWYFYRIGALFEITVTAAGTLIPAPMVVSTIANFTEGPTGTFLGTGAARVKFTNVFTGDCYIEMEYNGANNQSVGLTLDQSSTDTQLFDGAGTQFSIYSNATPQIVSVKGAYDEFDPGPYTTPQAGWKLWIRRIGSTISAGYKTAAGVSTTLYTFTATTSASLYPKGSTNVAKYLTNPKYLV